mmetsp:Transcript_29975/g.49482  ORF Transcript_29975/g.49482 Transcript_29975/m.49482 type:complete len:196 (+) Transcript_29975:63-650(+)|eukprot:CAMPEP_0119007286 /NCGR_PEP_ID=MMETSP1176-20130426/2906_1 /TAXON_ID=265551 /ORGANISM="Synedropsis recta cf, Strain CCMP1620" /LENGTH=195 /DNA_ID=CAMNT_0006959401 /DNA_START=49 /DNA_END=636 /DNA_ORIENTATION=-
MQLHNLLLTLFLAACMVAGIGAAEESDDGEAALKDCSKELKAKENCLQNNLLACTAECTTTNVTIDGVADDLNTCKQETNEFCSIAECCAICFGETQAALTCQFTYTNGTTICDTECACDDVPGWADADDYSCAWYDAEPAERCALFGDSNAHDGHTANTACCSCKLQIASGAFSMQVSALVATMVGAFVTLMIM